MITDPTRIERGRQGEDLAVKALIDRGYRIVARNWRPGNAVRGEIDCIAWHGDILCFIEVKTRSSNERGTPQESVIWAKQRQLSTLANAYVSRRKIEDTAFRFDVVEVWAGGDDSKARIVVHENAFDYIHGGTRNGRRIF